MISPQIGIILILAIASLAGCASAIVDGDYIRTSDAVHAPKSDMAPIELFFGDARPGRDLVVIGKLNARAYVLERGMDELRKQAREIGADAITSVIYERIFSVDYLQDLYNITADAVMYK